MNIFETFERQALRWSRRTAMEYQRENGEVEVFSYTQVLAQAQRYAQILQRLGICPGDRVAILSESCPQWSIAYLAVEKLCATAVLLDASLPQPELARLLDFSEVRAVWSSPTAAKKLSGTFESLVVLDITSGETLWGGSEAPETVTPGDPSVSTVLFSSGTTRTASGIMHGHDQLILTAASTVKENRLNHRDRYLAILPNSHIYGLICQLFGPLMTGASVRFLESLSAPSILQAFAQYHPTILPAVPKVFELLHTQVIRKVEANPKTQRLFAKLFPLCLKLRQKTGVNLGKLLFHSIHQGFGGALRILCSAGAPMKQETAEFYMGTGFRLLITYGATETNIPTIGNRGRNLTTDSCGKPYPGIEVSLSEAGELLIRSPYMMMGYFKDPEATRAAFDKDGWILSGDLGSIDPKGNIHINGRCKENIVLSTGKKVTPDDIERLYNGLAQLKELVICGIPVEGEGYDAVHAFAVAQPGKEAQAMEALRQRSAEMAHHLQLSKIHLVEEIPRTSLQKPKRYLLRKRALEQQEPTSSGTSSTSTPALDIPSMVSEIVARIAGVQPQDLSPQTRLFMDLAIDSLGAIDLSLELQEKCHVQLGHLLKKDTTLAQLVEWAGKKGGAAVPSDEESDYPKQKKCKDYALFHMVQKLFACVYHVNIQNQSVLPEDKGYIICANHVSNFDYIYLTLHFEKERFLKFCCMAKKELMSKKPLSKYLARICGMIPVDRGGMVVDAMENVRQRLQERWGVLIHPEGTRSKNGLMTHFKKGAAILAIEAGVPIIPAYIKGGYEIYPRWRKLPRLINWQKLRKFRVEVIYGDPISPKGKTPEELIALVEQAVRSLSLKNTVVS